MHADLFKKLRADAEAARANPVPGDQMADVVGDIDSLVKYLKGWRNELMAEMAPGDQGARFRVRADGRKATRSYNTQALLRDFTEALHQETGHMDVGGGVLSTLQQLITEGAVGLSWQWSKLQHSAERHDITLVIAKHEIADGDAKHHVGESWKDNTPKVEPRPDDREVL